jgi:hypothetical protein
VVVRTEHRNPAVRPPAGRHDQRRQTGSLRKKKSPALVSGAEDDDRSSFLRNHAIPIRGIGSSKRLLLTGGGGQRKPRQGGAEFFL